jgi:hypothetical protein
VVRIISSINKQVPIRSGLLCYDETKNDDITETTHTVFVFLNALGSSSSHKGGSRSFGTLVQYRSQNTFYSLTDSQMFYRMMPAVPCDPDMKKPNHLDNRE